MASPPSTTGSVTGRDGETPAGSIDALYEQVRGAMAGAEAAAPHGETPGPLEPTAIAPGIRVLALRTPTLPPAAHTNVYLVGPADGRGPQYAIDPGSPYADQQATLDQAIAADAAAGRPLAMILLTHHHGDHVGGAQALADRWGVPIAAHANTARRLAGRVTVTRELAPGEIVGEGDNRLTCVYTPGHADGHLCFARQTPDGRHTIAGDMVAGIGTILIDPSEGDMALYIESLERLLALPASQLLPAHGPAIADGPAKLREYIAHRLAREARVAGALARLTQITSETGATVGDLVAIAYSDTPKPLWGLAGRSLLAHLEKLVREDRARCVSPGRWSTR